MRTLLPRTAHWLALAGLPFLWCAIAGRRAMAPVGHDLAGHVWMAWSASRGSAMSTAMWTWPDTIDLVPYLGGWLDVKLGALVVPLVGPVVAWNLVAALYVVVAGLGGFVLARVAGASRPAALLGGLLLQLDGFVLFHLSGGRSEQVALGFVALAIGAAIHAWREPGATAPVVAGLAGAATVLASWQLGLYLACAMVPIGACLLREGASRARLLRWAGAAALAATIAVPWVVLFAVHVAHSGKFADETGSAVQAAGRGVIGVFGWLGPQGVRPTWLALAAAVAAPWLAPRRDRALWFVVLAGAAVGWLVALGPSPGWVRAGPPDAAWPVLSWLHSLPVVRWFVWPERLLCTLSLAAAPAAALAADAVARRIGARSLPRGLVAVVPVALVGLAVAEDGWARRWPWPGYALPSSPELLQLRDDPRPGAVVDLPIVRDAVRHIAFHDDQMVHGRPGMFPMPLHVRIDQRTQQRVATDPALAWFAGKRQGALRSADFDGLRAQGFAFVLLHHDAGPEASWRRAQAALTGALGPPLWTSRDRAQCWALVPSLAEAR